MDIEVPLAFPAAFRRAMAGRRPGGGHPAGPAAPAATAAGLDNTGQDDTLSVATAKTHVSRILAKLNARDRARLVVIAYETGRATSG